MGRCDPAHDLNGNLTSDGTATYTWNARDQLTSLTGASFQYDALGRRHRRMVGGTTTDWVYDALTPVQEQDGTQVTVTQLTGLGIDEYLVRLEGSGARYVLPDVLGSTVALADDAGAVQTEYTYAPFGATTVTGQAATNPHQFTGREADGTSLYYYRARYYQPSLSRFLSEDPIGFLGGDVNLYSYVGNSPLNWTDPEGLQWWRPIVDPFKSPGGKGAGKGIVSGGRWTGSNLGMVCSIVGSGIAGGFGAAGGAAMCGPPCATIGGLGMGFVGGSLGNDLCDPPPGGGRGDNYTPLWPMP